MGKYRNALPQLSDRLFLTDGGIETCFTFHEGLNLPHLAAVDLMKDSDGRAHLIRYYRRYADIARERGTGFIFESPTWRASRDWAGPIGQTPAKLAAMNHAAIDLMAALRSELETTASPMVLSGCVGPRGDGYVPGEIMTAEDAQSYHAWQIAIFRDSEADMVTAITMNYVEEAIGIVRAAGAAGMPAAISFTVETDGRLPTGQPLKEAIEEVDAATGGAPAYFMINCAHPTHFAAVLAAGGPWVERIRGLRANASMRSHAELDVAPDLDDGNPTELGEQYRELLTMLPRLNVLGGCCGTDHRHVAAIAHSCVGHAGATANLT